MSIWTNIKTYFLFRRIRKTGLDFPHSCKIHGVKNPDRQGALAQSGDGDELQIVHVPIENYPFNVYVYSIPLNRVLGRLENRLSEQLVYIFGKGFCRDGEIEDILGGAPDYDYFGCRIRILLSRTMMNDCDDFSHLYGE
ncbi:MAG: hypothetical protein IJX87_05670 [Clostridia bacterium]|nr:hypothetical protein [Clostridia bacterium]